MMKRLLAGLLFCAVWAAEGALVNNSFTDNNENDFTWPMVNSGWQAKGYWNGTGNGVVHLSPGDNWGVAQVNAVTGESGNELVFSFDWTPSAAAAGNSLSVSYQLIGWKAVGTPSTGVLFGGMNYDGVHVGTADGALEKVDLISGISGGTVGGNFATGYAATGQPGATKTVTLNLSLADDASGYTDVSDYDFIGFRFFIDSNDDSGNIGATIENVSLTTSVAQSVQLASADLKDDVRSGDSGKLSRWSFWWNPTGVSAGNSASYAALISPGGSVFRKTDAVSGANYTNSRGTDLSSANELQIYNNPDLNQWWLISGASAGYSTDGNDHYLIIGYTVQPGEGGNYLVKTLGGNSAPSKLAVYVNDSLIDSFSYETRLTENISLKTGALNAGDTVYICLASDSSFGRNDRRFYTNIEIDQLGQMDSFDTGYTITKIRTGKDGASSYIVGSSWEGTVLRMAFDGSPVWTNSLSGIMNHDLWCADITGDGNDEILTANADGNIYCLSGETGELMWQFKTNSAPMNAVCTVRGAGGESYVVCGGFDLSIYYLNTNGAPVKAVHSRSYSAANAWVDPSPTYDKLHVANFIRPLPMPDGSERLLVHGANSHVWGFATHLYEFDVLGNQPVQIHSLAGTEGFPSDMRVVDPDGDGQFEVLFGMNGNHDSARIYRYDLTNPGTNGLSALAPKDAIAANGLSNDFGYRTPQPEIIADGSGFKILTVYGNKIILAPPDLNPAQTEVLAGDIAFNDMWKDPVSGKIVLGSAQSGGSAVHIIDPTDPNWKSAFEGLVPPGKIAAMRSNMAAVHGQVDAFVKPVWERDPLPVYMLGYYEGSLGDQIADIQNQYSSPVFLNTFMPDREMTNWRYASETYLDNDEYRDRIDGRMNYTLTQQQAVSSISAQYAGHDGIAYWGGHGNDPYMYQRSTSEQIIDAGNGKTCVQIWPEIYGSDADFEWVLNDLFYPLGDHAKGKNAWVYFRSKAPMWFSVVHLPIWDGFRSGEYAEPFVAAQEETGAKINDLSVPGRVGLWASGAVDQWGSRAVPDMVRYNGLRTHCDQRIPSHYLRYSVYNMALGSTHINDHGVEWHEEYFELIYGLIAKGALFIPKREEIVSFSPVHLGMKEPDPSLISEVNGLKWNIFYDEPWEENNPRVFSRMNDSWPGAPVTGWDFSRFAAGVKDRTTHFLPSYQNGLVLITPPQDGAFAQSGAVRGRLDEKLHPLYRNIMQEFITDGTDYISPDGSTRFGADTYCSTVSNALAVASKKLPVTVSGDVAWVCAQTDPYHLRLTLVDGGFLNPNDRVAEVSFNTVNPVSVTDLLNGTTYPVTGGTSFIDVPLGLFRFIDVELSEPFFPENGWGEFASENGLTGAMAADFDGDGESDVYEYALGGNPTDSAIKGAQPELAYGHDDIVRFSHQQVTHTNAGVSYLTEWSDNLIGGIWSTAWGASITNPTADPDYAETEHRLYGGTNSQLFIRLKIQSP